jgi:hypothetical protein
LSRGTHLGCEIVGERSLIGRKGKRRDKANDQSC